MPLAALYLPPALVLSALASRLVRYRINARFLRIFVQLFAIASGVVLIVQMKKHSC